MGHGRKGHCGGEMWGGRDYSAAVLIESHFSMPTGESQSPVTSRTGVRLSVWREALRGRVTHQRVGVTVPCD